MKRISWKRLRGNEVRSAAEWEYNEQSQREDSLKLITGIQVRRRYMYVRVCVWVKNEFNRGWGQLIVQRDRERENSNSDEWSWQCAHNLELISI